MRCGNKWPSCRLVRILLLANGPPEASSRRSGPSAPPPPCCTNTPPPPSPTCLSWSITRGDHSAKLTCARPGRTKATARLSGAVAGSREIPRCCATGAPREGRERVPAVSPDKLPGLIQQPRETVSHKRNNDADGALEHRPPHPCRGPFDARRSLPSSPPRVSRWHGATPYGVQRGGAAALHGRAAAATQKDPVRWTN